MTMVAFARLCVIFSNKRAYRFSYYQTPRQVRKGQVKSEQVKSNQDMSSQVWTAQGGTGQVGSGQVGPKIFQTPNFWTQNIF